MRRLSRMGCGWLSDVIVGEMTPAEPLWKEVAVREEFIMIDCRTYMSKNPETVVRRYHDAQHEDVQTSVFERDGFAVIVKWVLEEVWACQKVSLGCNHGLHRSNVTGCFLESALNSVRDGEGRRAFNAMHFTTCGLQDKEVKVVINRAREWHNEPWALQPTVEQVFGKDAAMKSRTAFKNWSDCMGVIEGWSRMNNDKEVPAEVADDVARAGSGSGERAPKKPRNDGGAVVAATPSLHAAGCISSPAGSADVPEWVTFEPKAEAWRAFLVERGGDEVSQQELLLLAALSPEGWLAANSVLAKLAKKAAVAEAIRNPSAFVHACVMNARGAIPNGWFP